MKDYSPTIETSDIELQKVLKTKLHLHSDIKPWEELSAEEKNKDSMFIDDLQNIVAKLKLQVVSKSRNHYW